MVPNVAPTTIVFRFLSGCSWTKPTVYVQGLREEMLLLSFYFSSYFICLCFLVAGFVVMDATGREMKEDIIAIANPVIRLNLQVAIFRYHQLVVYYGV